MAIQLMISLKRNVRYALFTSNFWSNYFTVLLVIADSEIVDTKAFLSKIRKTSKDQGKIISFTQENGCSEEIKNVRRKCRVLLKKTLFCDLIVMGFLHGRFLRNVPKKSVSLWLTKEKLNKRGHWLHLINSVCHVVYWTFCGFIYSRVNKAWYYSSWSDFY